MSIKIFLEGIEQDELKSSWLLHMDVTCEICGKIQSYANYASHGYSCILCKHKEEIPVLIVGELPVVLNSQQEVNEVNNKLQSIIVAAQLLGYEKTTFKFIHNRNNPQVKVAFMSICENKRFTLTLQLDKYCKYKTTRFEYGKYASSTIEVKYEDDLMTILKELERAI